MTLLKPRFVSPRCAAALFVAIGLSGLTAGCMSTGDSQMSASAASMAAENAGARVTPIFIASTRRGDGRTEGETVADGGAHYAMSMVSVPPGHRAGEIEEPSFGKPNPSKHFAVLGGHSLEPQDFRLQLATFLSGRIGSNRDILLYVHGFNTSLDEARFRLAQLVNDGGFGGVAVLFTWPSKSDMFSYVSDKESATASRDALQKLMRDVSQVEGVGRVHVLAHSMGSWLAMESLRENSIAGSRNLGGRLGDVMLAAPDIDISVFRQQMSRIQGANVSIFVSANDRALNLSSRLAGARPRVGAMDPTKPRDRQELAQLGVKVYDLSSASAGFIGHSLYGDVPAVVRTIGAQLAAPRAEDSGVTAMIDATKRAVDPIPPAAAATTPPAVAPTTATPANGAVTASPLPPM
jgi:esterase/lipase superfamily enzyme